MAEATTEGSPGSQIHNIMRQRMLNRAATFSEGAQAPPLPHRRSSLLSEYSDTRHSFQSSTDNLLRPLGNNSMEKLTVSEATSFWHSAPLACAIVPAFAGLFFQNGGAVVTDILLLGFASMFLNWCVRTPWEWYHAAQQIQYVDEDEVDWGNTIPEEDENDEGSKDQDENASARVDATLSKEKAPVGDPDLPATKAQEEARQELKSNEMLALFTCFLGPLVGAYLLHAIRSQLTQSAEGLVSNYSLTIFVMGAELRPVHHVIKMRQARMLHLQRIVRSSDKPEKKGSNIQEIAGRLAELEARTAEPTQNSGIESLKISATVRQGIQPQLDALNRAVRRYEKRQAAQSIQIEARFQELEGRLRDALSLAAAAARTGQRPGIVAVVLTWFTNLFAYLMQASWAVTTYPYRTAAAATIRLQSLLMGSSRQPHKRLNGQSNGSSSGAPSRVQSRNSR